MRHWIVNDWYGNKWQLPPGSVPFSMVNAVKYYENAPYIVAKLRGTS